MCTYFDERLPSAKQSCVFVVLGFQYAGAIIGGRAFNPLRPFTRPSHLPAPAISPAPAVTDCLYFSFLLPPLLRLGLRPQKAQMR